MKIFIIGEAILLLISVGILYYSEIFGGSSYIIIGFLVFTILISIYYYIHGIKIEYFNFFILPIIFLFYPVFLHAILFVWWHVILGDSYGSDTAINWIMYLTIFWYSLPLVIISLITSIIINKIKYNKLFGV